MYPARYLQTLHLEYTFGMVFANFTLRIHIWHGICRLSTYISCMVFADFSLTYDRIRQGICRLSTYISSMVFADYPLTYPAWYLQTIHLHIQHGICRLSTYISSMVFADFCRRVQTFTTTDQQDLFIFRNVTCPTYHLLECGNTEGIHIN